VIKALIVALLVTATFAHQGAHDKNKTVFTNEEIEYIKNKKTVVACYGVDTFPYADSIDGTMVGIASDIQELLAKKTGLRFVNKPYSPRVDALEELQRLGCEMLMIHVYKLHPYTKLYEDTDSFISDHLVLITKNDIAYIQDVPKLEGKTVAVPYASYKKWLGKVAPNLNVVVFTDTKKMAQSIKSGKYFGVVELSRAANHLIQTFGDGTLKVNTRVCNDCIIKGSSSTVKSDPLLHSIIQKSYSSIPKGELESIIKKWEIPTYTVKTDYKKLWVIVLFFTALTIVIVGWLMSTKRANKNLRMILDSAQEIMAFSTDKKIVEINNQGVSLLGYTNKKEIIGMKVCDIVDPSYRELVSGRMQENYQEIYEVRLKRKDGSTFPVLVRGTNFGNNKRLSCAMDISSIKAYQEELQKANSNLQTRIDEAVKKNEEQQALMFHQSRHAQMGEMISMIAHQWRQPLNTLSLYVQNITNKFYNGKLEREVMEHFDIGASKQIEQMSKTIDDFRDFFKNEKEKSHFELRSYILNHIDILKPMLSKANIVLNHELESGIFVTTYKNELGQAVLNILINAIDALGESSKPDKKIELRLYTAEQIIFSIEDSAGGIPQEMISQIFDPYFSTKSDKNGTGLGLYISKIIIQDNIKGTLSVENTDMGAKFVIALNKAGKE